MTWMFDSGCDIVYIPIDLISLSLGVFQTKDEE